MRTPSREYVRRKLAGVCHVHGYRLVSFRKDKGELYLIVIQWRHGERAPKEFRAKLEDAVAVVNAYVTAASGVYFLP